jgi:glycerol-3-phosphate acyltransferase PlsX
VRIIIDAMGGDNAPKEVVKGAVIAAEEYGCSITLVGIKERIEEVLKEQGTPLDGFEIVDAAQVITNDESPTEALRKKKDSSLVVGLGLLRDGKGDAFISAGSTGAVLAGGTLIVKRIKGIMRPAICPVIPGRKKPFLLMDAGANADCKPQYIQQFAIMGSIYAENVLKREHPQVAIVNIGSEEEKGSRFVKECYAILKDTPINFKGSIEGREIPTGDIDVVVTDGFTGNVILKMFEGTVETIFSVLKEGIMSSVKTKLGGVLLKPVFKSFKRAYDYTEHGGAVLLGLNSPVIKAHGSSNAKAIKNAVRQAISCVEGNITGIIRTSIELQSAEGEQAEE